MTQFKQYRDDKLSTDGSVAAFYEREFYPFSNFSSFMVNWRGYDWMTSEHAYHSEKFYGIEPKLVEALKEKRSAHDALMFARLHKERRRGDWDDVKRDIMKDICRAKLSQHAYIQRKLMDTGKMILVEDSPIDDYWGWGPNRNGQNNLGNIWMELREEQLSGKIKQI